MCCIRLVLLMALGVSVVNAADVMPKKIVVIGGKKSHGLGEHDFPNGVRTIEAALKATLSFKDATIVSYPDGWPTQADALDHSSTLVFYFDGVQNHPLLDTARLEQVKKLMDAGTGLICLHQASTVPKDDKTIPFVEWLGGCRYGMADRTTEPVSLKPETPGHPISRGLGEINYRDEFYPTLVFNDNTQRITPILRSELKAIAGQPPKTCVLAWAYERTNNGRSFGFTGFHYVDALNHPALKKMLLNAIAWTAGIGVPPEGVAEAAQPSSPAPTKAIVTPAEKTLKVKMEWGELTWFVSGQLKNSGTMTTGKCVIHPGYCNPRHYHPNCDEVLHVLKGKIKHSMDDVTAEMNEGDTVSIPKGVRHNATNIGTEDAILFISFSSPDRQVIGE